MLHRQPASASAYNALPLIGADMATLSATEIAVAGNVIRKYNMEHIFGIHFLHRHFIIPDNKILASSTTVSGVEIHIPINSSLHYLHHATHYFVDTDGTFLPYEFSLKDNLNKNIETGPAVGDFLHEFANTILTNRLEDRVALSIVGSDHDFRCEVTGTGWTAHFPCKMSTPKCLDKTLIPVGWTFESGAENVTTAAAWQPNGSNKDTGHDVISKELVPPCDSPDEFVQTLRDANIICCS